MVNKYRGVLWSGVMLGDNADKGLISMGKASYFMKGGGGYSDLIGEIVKMNGGEVL